MTKAELARQEAQQQALEVSKILSNKKLCLLFNICGYITNVYLGQTEKEREGQAEKMRLEQEAVQKQAISTHNALSNQKQI